MKVGLRRPGRRKAKSESSSAEQADDGTITVSYGQQDFVREVEQAERDALTGATAAGAAVAGLTAADVAAATAAEEPQTWCSINGAMAAISGGLMGYAFGFGALLIT